MEIFLDLSLKRKLLKLFERFLILLPLFQIRLRFKFNYVVMLSSGVSKKKELFCAKELNLRFIYFSYTVFSFLLFISWRICYGW